MTSQVDKLDPVLHDDLYQAYHEGGRISRQDLKFRMGRGPSGALDHRRHNIREALLVEVSL